MKVVRESLNESAFSCNIHDLYKAVIKEIKTNISSNMQNITVDIDNNEVTVKYMIDTTVGHSWQNLDPHGVQEKLNKVCNSFTQHFDKFKDFCEDGLRGATSIFRKKYQMVNVYSSYQLDLINYVTNERKDPEIFRYESNASSSPRNLGSAKYHTNRYGTDNLGKIFIETLIVLKEI